MESFTDYLDELIFLDDELKQVILLKHPEVSDLFEHVKKTLKNPDIVKRSKVTDRSRLYYRFFSEIFEGKFLVIVVKSADYNFISTIYLTDKVKEGDMLWQKK
jgi:hypothetical protein